MVLMLSNLSAATQYLQALVTQPSGFEGASAFVALLPELTLLGMLSYLLTVMSLELGAGRDKKVLALESALALRSALAYVIVLYILQLINGNAQELLHGYLATSTFITALKLLTLLSGRFILTSSLRYITEHPRHLLEYPLVLTLALLFMLLLIGASHLISAFLALVGFSLNLYVLILFDAPTAIAREAGIKYFYLSAFSSGLILYGVFLLFLLLGTGQFSEMQHALSTVQPTTVTTALLQFAILFVLTGVFFKLSAFPGHLWAAEVYEGSPDPIAAFFMLPVKVAVLAFVIQLLTTALEPAKVVWQPLIALSAAASLIWGCVAAFVEKKTKRFLAYASINQIGFLLLGLAAGTYYGYRATLLYLFLYALMNIVFLMVFLHARRPDGESPVYLTDFRDLGSTNWLLSWSVAITLLSMAGIPPLAGFFGKYYLLLHVQEQGIYGLVFVALGSSLVSTYYYLRVIKIFWFEGTNAATSLQCSLTAPQYYVLFIIEGILWTFVVFAGLLMLYTDICTQTLIAPYLTHMAAF